MKKSLIKVNEDIANGHLYTVKSDRQAAGTRNVLLNERAGDD